MSKKYRNEDLREMFGLSHETIRKYSLDFAEFLSEGANPPEGKHRDYSENDLRVFAVVASMKASNHTNEDIASTLRAGLSGELANLLDDSPILSPTMERTIARQEIANLQRGIEQANERSLAAEAEAQEWRDKANKYEGEIKRLEKEIESLRTRQEGRDKGRDELLREIGKLSAMLEMAKGKGE